MVLLCHLSVCGAKIQIILKYLLYCGEFITIIAFSRCFSCLFYTPGTKFESKIMAIIETTKPTKKCL